MMTAKQDRPNVLVIMTDQHRHDLLSCTGNNAVPTPNIDRIAAHGIRFANAFCPYPVCVASRMSLLTGLYPHHTGAINNDDTLDWRFRTIADHFSDNGYLTGLIGKMHFNDAHKHGFEYNLSINDWLMYLGPKVRHYADEIASSPFSTHFYETMNDSGAGFPEVEGLWEGPSPWVGNVRRFERGQTASVLDADDHLDMFVARETEKFLHQYREQPFLLVSSFMKPHDPFFPPKEYAERYPADEIELPETGNVSAYPEHIQHRIRRFSEIDTGCLEAARAGYYGNLAFVDSCIGRVYDALYKEGLQKNTIVVYTSDHGEMDGDHGLWQKFCLFDPAVRVPLVMSQPGKIPEGAVSAALIEYFRIYPTVSDLAGLPFPPTVSSSSFKGTPKRLDARSFSDLAIDPSATGPPAVFSEFALRSDVPRYMIRTRSHKYILNFGSTDELYDYEVDPGEFENKINDPSYSVLAAGLRQQLVDWHDPGVLI